MAKAKVDWRGKQVVGIMDEAAENALQEFGLKVESGAKRLLRPGHGVVTGTLRRSIHTADPDYVWQSDNVGPSGSSPERGGQSPKIKKKGSKLQIVNGSGLVYAMPVHQGHGSFEGYHFLLLPYEELKDDFPDIYAKHSRAMLRAAP